MSEFPAAFPHGAIFDVSLQLARKFPDYKNEEAKQNGKTL